MAQSSSGSLKKPSAVRILWVDGAGIRRVRAVPYDRYNNTLLHGLGLTQACMGMLSHADMLAPGAGLSAVGEIRLVPKLESTVKLPYYPAHCLAIGELHKVGGEAWELCPRSALRRVLQQAKDMFGIEVRAGFESEFVLMRPKGGANGAAPDAALAYAGQQEVVPVDTATYCNSTAFQEMAPVLDDMVAGLESCGIEVTQYHAESAPGQYEISTGAYDALTAVDKLIITRETITGVARQHQLLASFLPKIRPNVAGNGAHVHISIWKEGKNLLEAMNPDESLTKLGPGAYFVAGVLRHLPSLLPFTAPSHFSYLRLTPNCWSGAYNVWGWDNREAPIRLTVPPSGRKDTNFEVKATDATANPYIALAAIISAGLLGLLKHLSLPAPVTLNPADLSAEELAAKGFARLPTSLQDAIKTLKDDAELLDALDASIGPNMLKCLIAVREAEVKYVPTATEALFRY